jgi:uncharacterized membrane protein SpoIIM required for sporulation
LKSAEFRRQGEPRWRELERLVEKAEKGGIASLTPEQLAMLPILYRAASSSLGVARAISLDANVLAYLEALVARAYFCVYGTRRHLREAVAEFFSDRFPRAVRSLSGPILLSALILFLGLAAGFFLTRSDPERFHALVPEEMSQGRTPESSTESLRGALYHESRPDSNSLVRFAAFLFTHNSRVGLTAFALGFALGVPVFVLMLYNGLLLGAFSALYASRGLSVELWAWILPHGVTEMTAVVFCGGAGLAIARSIVFPGRHTRLENLAVGGREAGVVAVGACAMLFVAGVIEGVFRQTVLHVGARYALAGFTVLCWSLYFGRAGRRGE